MINNTTDYILYSVKKPLGGMTEEYTHFDQDLLIHINGAFAILNQLGMIPDDRSTMVTEESAWSDYFTSIEDVSLARSYVCSKVHLIFDPPASAVLLGAIERTIQELESRMLMRERSVHNAQ